MLLELTVVAEGLGFPEGPVAMSDGSVLFVDLSKQTLSRLTADGQIIFEASIPGGPNGAAVGPKGLIYICNNGGVHQYVPWNRGMTIPGPQSANYTGGSIQRVDLKTKEVKTLYDQHEGARLLAPDDLVFDEAGGFWFTDMGIQDPDRTQFGALYYATTDGQSIQQVARLPTPNGVGLSPDGRTVYVADTHYGRLWALDILGPGKVGPGPFPMIKTTMPGRVVKTLPGFQYLDSLKVEASGRICVGTIFNGGITVFTPEGETEHLFVPDFFTTNMCFGGEDMQDVWITASSTGKIYKTRWPRPGLKVAFSEFTS